MVDCGTVRWGLVRRGTLGSCEVMSGKAWHGGG